MSHFSSHCCKPYKRIRAHHLFFAQRKPTSEKERRKDFCKIRDKTGAGPLPPSSRQSARMVPCPSTAPSPLNHQHLQMKNHTTGAPGPLPYIMLCFLLIPGISLITIIINKKKKEGTVTTLGPGCSALAGVWCDIYDEH